MTEFTTHTIETAPEASKPTLEAAQKKFGFVPNLFAKLAESPVAAEAYLTMAGLNAKSSFTPAEQQVVLLTSNFENECHYCMAAHTGAAKMAKLPEDAIEALRSGAPIPDARLEALRSFARKVVAQRGWVEAADVDAFLAAGFTKAQVLEVVVGVAFKVISNYTNHIVDTPLDDKFAPFKWEKPADQAA
jgi:uncharacterized peroxidase-related enzyme